MKKQTKILEYKRLPDINLKHKTGSFILTVIAWVSIFIATNAALIIMMSLIQKLAR